MKMSFYDVLKVNKNATPDIIKKSYLILAKLHHPDKGGQKEHFQKIQEAYETLSDVSKKSAYDQKEQQELEKALKKRKREEEELIQYQQVSVPLETAFKGGSIQIQTKKKGMCQSCHGKGGIDCRMCDKCPGLSCGSCSGRGYTVGVPCDFCSGSGKALFVSYAPFEIPAGSDDGDKFIVSKERYEGIQIQVNKNHEVFQKEGKNLKTCLDVHFMEAMFGFERKIKFLDGSVIQIKQTALSSFKEQVFLIHGFGFPLSSKSDEKSKGHLYVKVSVLFPSSEEKKKLNFQDMMALKSIFQKMYPPSSVVSLSQKTVHKVQMNPLVL